jgi:hypothetical protein
MALTIMASAGSFAAISTLLGSPVLGAFLIMEAAGIGGMTLSLVALPGLLAYRRTVDPGSSIVPANLMPVLERRNQWRCALESPETSCIPCFGNRITPTG